MSLQALVAPANQNRKRSKKEVVKAILEIPREDYSNNLMAVAESIAKHEVMTKRHLVLALARCLESVGQLATVRLLSTQLAAVFAAEGAFGMLYQQLYLSPVYTNPEARRCRTAFRNVAHNCAEVVASVKERYGNHGYASGAIFRADAANANNSAAASDVSDWAYVFEHCRRLRVLTIRTGTCSTGMLWNRTSSALAALRMALEAAELPVMTTLRMAPADMVYVGQFKSSNPAFGEPSATTDSVWSRITDLELQLLHPLELGNGVQARSAELFSSWLQAFAPLLKSLKLCYLGNQNGQNPFVSISDPHIQHRRRSNLHMPRLRELWLGRVMHAEEARNNLQSRAPELTRFHVLLRSQSLYTLATFDLSDQQEQWRTIYIRRFESWNVEEPPIVERDMSEFRRDNMLSRMPSSPESLVMSRRSDVAHSNLPTPDNDRSHAAPSRTLSSSIKAYFRKSSADEGGDHEAQRSSLPLPSRPHRGHASSIVTSILKLKPRPESDPSRPMIRLVGEAPLEQVPHAFPTQGTRFTPLQESIARYGAGTVSDLSGPPALRLAEEQRIGLFDYTPGTLFRAGSGARVPNLNTEGRRRREDGRVGGPRPGQVQRAIETLAWAGQRDGDGDGDEPNSGPER